MTEQAIRITRAKGLKGGGRSTFKVLMDDVEVGRFRSNSTLAIPVDAGDHTLQVRVMGWHSDVVRVHVDSDQTTDMICHVDPANSAPLRYSGLPYIRLEVGTQAPALPRSSILYMLLLPRCFCAELPFSSRTRSMHTELLLH